MYQIKHIKYILVFILFNNIEVFSQIIELKNINESNNIKKTTYTLDTIQLPFWDDFSSYESTVGNNFWNASRNVSVNNFSNNMSPSLNVLILDGTDEDGNPYNFINQSRKADSLCSDIIDLKSYQYNDQLYFSFYWNYNINGEFPDYEDSIKLDFYSVNNTWKTVWFKPGGSNNFPGNNFNYHILPLDNEYLHEKFMFKFYNIGNTEGPFDSWAIDYIYLDKNRTINDTLILDRTITYKPRNIFKNFNAIPIEHLNSSSEILDSIETQISNLDSQIQPINYSLIIKDLSNNINEILENNTPLSPILNGFERRTIKNKPIDFEKYNITKDSLDIEVKFFINSGDSIYENQNLRLNDTTKTNFKMSNYYSYDDDNAEYAAGLNQKNSELVIRYKILEMDTLTHIQILFPESTNKTYEGAIKLVLYKKLNNERINLISQSSSQINYGESFNIFKLETPIIVSDTIYIGYKQFEDNLLTVGLDKNNNTSEMIYYLIDNQWKQNEIIKGSLMIRPVFGNVDGYITKIKSEKNKNIKIYPNPGNSIFYLNKKVEHLNIYNIKGEIIKKLKDVKKFDLSNKKNGLYIIHLKNKENYYIKRIIKN